MSQNTGKSGSDRLVLALKGAYSVALVIIAAMALATYLLLQGMIAAHQEHDALLEIIDTQKTLSQRVVFLAGAAPSVPADAMPPLLAALKEATTQFEQNHDRLLAELGGQPAPAAAAVHRPGTAQNVLFGAPYYLDYYATDLAVNGRRLYSALEAPDAGAGAAGLLPLDKDMAEVTLDGYAALRNVMAQDARAYVDRTLTLHRLLFFATVAVILLIALFIFRPMIEVVRRKTGELVDARNSMAYIAIHDGLTGLNNRIFMRDHFDTLIRSAERRKERLAVIQLDLDRFKQINDTLGHAAGDFVLVKTAERMRASCRASDICARLGGDEFVMVMPAAGSSDDIDRLAQRILDRINEPIVFGGATIMPGASAGIAVYPLDADNGEDLMVHADLALYSAKRQGGGGFAFFSDELRRELDHRKRLEQDIRTTIEADGFIVYFQPQVSLASGAVTGVEALVRWHHEERGVITPGEFIPVAEKAGLMPAIGRIVMRKAISEAAAWHRGGVPFGRLAINVSGTELREPDFNEFLFSTLGEAGLPPEKLSLEIVESVILDDEKTGIAAKLRAIRAAGIYLELDDFGTGYASLSHVNPNEIDRLKIDRRFVQNIHANDDNSKIVRAITELARGLGISILAEGAETEDELTLLQSIGCEEVQGYSIAFPMPDAQAREWLVARAPRKPVLTVVKGSIA